MNQESSRKKTFKLALHHLWSRLLLLFAIVIVLLAIGLVIIRASTPLLVTHHQNIQAWLEKRLNYPLQFGSLAAGWKGFEPIIKIDDVTISNSDHQPLIHLDHFAIGFNLFQSVIARQLKIGLIIINGATFKIVDQGDGSTIVYGNTALPIATIKNGSEGNGKLIQELFAINKIHLENVRIIWKQATGQCIQFHKVMLEMLNKGNQHHAWGIAASNQPQQSKVAFVANLEGNIVNKKTLKGNLYIHGRNLELKQWLPTFQFRDLAINNGYLSGQTWMILKKGAFSSVQGILHASNLDLSNSKTQQKSYINDISANLDWERTKNAWSVSADNIIVNNNLNNAPAESLYFSETIDPTSKQPAITAYLQFIPINILKEASVFFGNQTIADLLSVHKVSGDLRNIYLRYSSSINFAGSITFNHVGFNLDPTSRTTHLNGAAYFFPTMGELDLQSNGLQLNTTRIPLKSLVLTNWHLNKLYGFYNQNTLVLKSQDLQFATPTIAIQGKFLSSTPLDNLAATQLNAAITTNSFDLTQLRKYVPSSSQHHQHVFKFLSTAFLKGTASAQIRINGQLNQFPFKTGGGTFNADLQIQNLNLQFKNTWPALTDLTGQLYFNNQKMTATSNSGLILGIPLTNIAAVIPDISDSSHPIITVQGDVNTTLKQGMDFVSKTPLKNTLGEKLKELTFQGPAQLHLNMEFSLKSDDHQKDIQGNLITKNATVSLPAWGLQFNNVTGQLNFSNDAIAASQLTGEFLNQTMTANITTLNPTTSQSVLQINAASRFLINYLKSKIQNRFLDKLSGTTNFTAQLQIFKSNSKANTLTINSSLTGVAIELPVPFIKSANSQMPLTVTASFSKAKPMSILAKLGSQISFQTTLEKLAGKLQFMSGNLHFGTSLAKPQTSRGLLIDGIIPSFVWQDWKSLLISDSVNHSNFNQYIRLINVTVNQLNFYSYIFSNTNVQASYKNNRWNLVFNAPLIAGNINVPTQSSLPITANLSRLYLRSPEKTQLKSKNTLNPVELPPLNITINSFQYNNSNYGQVHFVTARTATGLDVDPVEINLNNAHLSALGFWKNQKSGQLSSLQGTLIAKQAADLLSNSNHSNNFNAQDLQLKFNLQWPGNIFQPSLKTVTGSINLQAGAGVINNMGSSANSEMATGELLTLLSFQSLQRRLTLNFNDLTNKGFSFDTIKGDFNLAKGLASTKNTSINGIVATINLNGNINVNNETFDLYLQVIPKVTSSIPIIATIAGGPVVGAATWVVDKLFSQSVNQIAAKYFHLGGSWAQPKVTPVNPSTPVPKSKRSQFL